MKQLVSLALALGLAAPAFASGTPFVIDFEKSWDYGQAVDDSYAALGVSFTNVLGLSNGDGLGGLPDGAYYAGAPSPLGVGFVQLDGVQNTTAYMNVAGGVDGTLNFFYSSTADFEIKAYSGLNGTGDLLGTLTLSANTSDYTSWNAAAFSFSGSAHSFDLSGAANVAALDNISAVPEPASALLLLAGGALLAATRRRRD